MKMLVTRVLPHGEGDPMVKVGGVEMASDHGTQPQNIHAHEVWLDCAEDGYSGHLRMMVNDAKVAETFVEGETVEVTFGAVKAARSAPKE